MGPFSVLLLLDQSEALDTVDLSLFLETLFWIAFYLRLFLLSLLLIPLHVFDL